ncbi:MAG: dUTP diphosphatase [Candidatus Uhrbacteria bacterium]
MDIEVKFKKLDPNLPDLAYQTAGAVAFDLPVRESVTIEPGEKKIIPTGYVVCVPKGHALILAPRSSNAKKGLPMANGIGVIDQDYCGPNDELHLALFNRGKESYTTEVGERLAQGLFIPISRAKFVEVDELDTPNRGGFGTTG